MAADALIFDALLTQFGVARDSSLIVHSAFALLSRQGFAAEAVIDTLLERVRNGNLFMPTMTWRTVTPAQPNWDELGTASHTGVLSEIFRVRYAVARSIHPTHSVAGWGRAAPLLLSRHHVDETPVSANSPYGFMRDYDTFVLMIGVGMEACTAIHLAEETINEDLYVLPPVNAETYQCRDRAGTLHQVRTRRHRRLDRNFPKFVPVLSAKGLLQHGQIGSCPWLLFTMRAMLREVFAALLENPRAIIGR